MKDGDPLFHANHGNLNTASALAATGKFEAARAAMQILQQDGIDLNLSANYLIVPPNLVDTGEVMLSSSALAKRQAGASAPKIVSDSLLQNGLSDPYTGQTVTGSATTWYLAADGEHGQSLQVRYM